MQLSLKEGLNSKWSTPIWHSIWPEYPGYAADICNTIQRCDKGFEKDIDSVSIAGLDEGLTTKWYAYNFLDLPETAVQKLRIYIFSEVDRYMVALGHKNDSLYYQCWANLLKNQDTLSIHSHAGPYSYISGVFFAKTVSSSTKYFLPLDRRIPGVENFYETDFTVENVEGGVVLFPSFIEHCSTPTLENLDRMTIAFDILLEPPVDRFHNSFGHKVISKYPKTVS
jgi:hypothetical protein